MNISLKIPYFKLRILIFFYLTLYSLVLATQVRVTTLMLTILNYDKNLKKSKKRIKNKKNKKNQNTQKKIKNYYILCIYYIFMYFLCSMGSKWVWELVFVLKRLWSETIIKCILGCHTLGVALFVFKALPNVENMFGLFLMNALCIVPAILKVIFASTRGMTRFGYL